MTKRPVDVDIKQSIKDLFLTKNEYHLDDRFVIRDGQKHPFAVLVPGGGYSMVCSFIEGVPIAKQLNMAGISAFIVYYRTRNKALYPAPQDDLARGIKEIFAKAEEYNIDTNNYSIWGASAGGHLVASFGTKEVGYAKYNLPKPSTLVLMYPVITMNPKFTHMGTHDNILGKNPSPELEDLLSVEKHVDKDYPATYIWCSDDDATVPSSNTTMMKEALTQASVNVQCTIYHGVPHGVGPGSETAAQGWIAQAIRFWEENKK